MTIIIQILFFWFKKGNNYNIVFIDPHGVEHTEYQSKIEGYRKLFENRIFTGEKYGLPKNLKARIFLFLATDRNYQPQGYYQKYWFISSNVEKILEKIVKTFKG